MNGSEKRSSRFFLNRFLFCILILAVTMIAAGCSGNDGNLSQSPETRSESGAGASERTVFPAGTAVDNCDLSGLDEESAPKRLQEWAGDKLEEKIKLVYNNREKTISLQDLGLTLDIDKTMQAVDNNLGKKVAGVWSFVRKEQNLQPLYEAFNQAPTNASFTITGNTFKITPASEGWAFNYEETMHKLTLLALTAMPEELEVAVSKVDPQIPTESLQKLSFDSLICQFATRYNVNEKNRSANLVRAAKVFDGKLVSPNQTVSFNQWVGPRTPERGYKDAYVIINNEYVEGTGGGICQVSSTLYNAALLANLQIVERHPHAAAIQYIPLGRDATVNYPNLDLKFRNPFPYYVYLRVEAGGGLLRISVYGKKTDQTVRIENVVGQETDYKVERRYDASLAPGDRVVDQKGSKGYTVSAYKVVTNGRGKESKQLISKDVYKPLNQIVRVGPRTNFQP